MCLEVRGLGCPYLRNVKFEDKDELWSVDEDGSGQGRKYGTCARSNRLSVLEMLVLLLLPGNRLVPVVLLVGSGAGSQNSPAEMSRRGHKSVPALSGHRAPRGSPSPTTHSPTQLDSPTTPVFPGAHLSIASLPRADMHDGPLLR